MNPSLLVRALVLLALLALVARVGAQESAFLTSRPRPEAKAIVPVKVGDEISTSGGQRRRVVLANGVTVFLNQNSRLKYAAMDEVNLSEGEAFIDVRGRRPDPAKASPLFTVKTTKNASEGRDASWVVKQQSSVAVIRGTINVSPTNGKTRTISAGTHLAGDEMAPLPRASHVLDWTRDLMLASESPLVPGSEYAGGALVAVDPNGQEAKLELRKFHVDVHIEDGFARTTIDQTYFNHEPSQLEGTFFFPLPPDASLSRLGMYVDGQLQEGGIVERDLAQRIYDEFRYANRDPALLEWVDGSTFKMRVFPIEGRQEKRLILSYSQKLPVLNADMQYRFPAGHSLQTVRDWSFQARIKNGASFNWASPSHPLTARTLNGELILDGSAKNVRTDRDVVVSLMDKMEKSKEARFSSTNFEDARYLMVRYQPDLVSQARAQRRDWVFLFEASGDRNPLLARAQIEVIRNLLMHAEADDTFTVLAANTRVRTWAKEPRPVTTENILAAVAFLEATHLIGALDLGQALGEAANFLALGTNPHLVHLGSGVPAMGERREDVLARRIPDGTRYVGIGVGRRWARSFMKAAAERSGGLFTQINPDEPISWRAFDLLATLNTPRLMNIQVALTNDKARFLMLGQTLAQGEEIGAIARLDKGQDVPQSLTITGILDGKPWQKIVPVKDIADHAGYLPRTWAKLEIDRLLTEDARKHKNAIVTLSKSMYVMTPFTSLLVLENEDMYTQYKVDRGRKDHWAMYPCPAKIAVVYEPLDGEPDPKTVGKKMTVRQTLGTIVSVVALAKKVQMREEELTRTPGVQDASVRAPNISFPEPFMFEDRPIGSVVLNINSSAGLILAVDAEPKMTGMDASFAQRYVQRPVELGTTLGLMRMSEHLSPAGYPGQIRGGFAGSNFSSAYAAKDDNPIWPSGNARIRDQMPVVSVNSIEGALEFAPLLRPSAQIAQESIRYYRPSYSLDNAFFDLVAYAPGMSTNMADVRAVLEAEAQPLPGIKTGQIDPAARALLQKARAAGWQSWTLQDDKGQATFTIYFDQRGSYQYERTLPFGVREKVMCDGKTLLHLYPQLGIGAKREVSRFHRAEFVELVPWMVPSPEDLAHGADVKLIKEGVIAITPRGRGTPSPAGKPAPDSIQSHLLFTPAGQLTERRVVLMPKNEILYRLECTSDGVVKLLDAKNKQLSIRQGKLTATADKTPNLESKETKALVMLSLPYRTPEHIRKSLKIENKDVANLRFQEALPLFAAAVAAGNKDEAGNIFRRVFLAHDQRQLGFYVLLASCGNNLDSQNFDVLAEHLDEPIAQYLALHTSPVLRKHASQWAVAGESWPDGFLKDLALTHALLQRWESDKVLKGDPAKVQAERRRALEHVRRHKDNAFGWTLLGLMQKWDGMQKGDGMQTWDGLPSPSGDKDEGAPKAKTDGLGSPSHKTSAAHKTFLVDLAACSELFKDNPDLSYAARYESARCQYQAGQKLEARKRFEVLYADTLKQNLLPAIDMAFRQALEDKTDDPWSRLMTATAKQWIADKHRPAVLALARQCWRLDDLPLAQHLLSLALQGVTDDKERVPMILAEIELLREMGQVPQADALLTKLLSEPQQARRPDLWRLAGTLAGRRDMPARAIECLEKAVDLEFRKLPDVIDLKAVRGEYRELLTHYQNLADAMVALKIEPPPGFLTKVIKTADRWRSLDQEGDEVCKATAQILDRLGDRDLSWDYLTTPIALSPGESSAWTNLAVSLSRRGDLKLADRAYQSAFEAEPANAQLLWDRAQNLRQAGEQQQALKLMRLLAESSWHVRFQGLQTQARLQLVGE